MRWHLQTLPILVGILVLLLSPACQARRVRVRPVNEEAEDQEVRDQHVQYYAAQAPADDDTQSAGVVLVSQDAYGGLQYTRPRAQTAVAEPQTYRPLARALTTARPIARAKEAPRQPPVQTIRNYSKVNDDGSFTFGYEAADGSFKEETRGTDCVVRGKYGYVDPDGNKREFTYVSGNPCDPNAVSQEEEEHPKGGLVEDSGEENIPRVPVRPLRPRPTAAPIHRPTTTVFQQSYNQADEEEEDEQQQVYQPPVRARVIPQPTRRPHVYQTYATQEPQEVVTQRPAIRITPRPPTAATTAKSQLPATTYRPQLLGVSVTPRPGVLYTKQVTSAARPAQPSIYATPTTASPVDFDAELRKFQIENNVVSTPRPSSIRPAVTAQPIYQTTKSVSRPQHGTAAQPAGKALSSDPVYQTELVYDPSTGQYNTVLYQTLPQTTGEVNLKHRLQPYVHTQQPTSLFTPQVYQHIQQNQQLYAQHQQQQRVADQRYQPQAPQATTKNTGPQRFQLYQQHQQPASTRPIQQFYYIAPEGQRGDTLAHGQIDAFLRGHNIAF